MPDKTMATEDAAALVESGMTIGLGGWGLRRKPMALIRALLRSDLEDLTVVTFGGPDVGLLVHAGTSTSVSTTRACMSRGSGQPWSGSTSYRPARGWVQMCSRRTPNSNSSPPRTPTNPMLQPPLDLDVALVHVNSAMDPSLWQTFKQEFLCGDEAAYHAAVARFHEEENTR